MQVFPQCAYHIAVAESLPAESRKIISRRVKALTENCLSQILPAGSRYGKRLRTKERVTPQSLPAASRYRKNNWETANLESSQELWRRSPPKIIVLPERWAALRKEHASCQRRAATKAETTSGCSLCKPSKPASPRYRQNASGPASGPTL